MKKRALMIGGTGTISTAVVKRLVDSFEWEVFVLNRGNRPEVLPEGMNLIAADMNDEEDVLRKLKDLTFDSVCEFIGFEKNQVERDVRLFRGRTKQYLFTSSASAYHKPCADYRITEGTALANPYWEYSRNKIACEEYLMKMYRTEGFPVTIVRPSHTYDERKIPVGLHGRKGSYQVVKRIMEGKPVLIHGDGTSLWTLTFNRDFATGYVGLMGNRHAIGEAFQITGDETLTWNQIYQTIADALGVELKAYHVSSDFLSAAGRECGYDDMEGNLTGDKAASVVFDNTKLKRVVPDMKTTVRFDQGVRICLEYILSHPECQIEDPEYDRWCDKVIAVLEKAKEAFR